VARATVFGLAWLYPPAILRLADYLYGVGVAAAELLGLVRLGGWFGRGPASEELAGFWPVWLLLGLAWVQLWWFFAIRRGFMLRTPWLVWCVLSIPVLLAWVISVLVLVIALRLPG
jgi:hypothetical protein